MSDRMPFSSGELRLLCDCVATICFNIAGGHGNRGFLPAADGVLSDLGQAAHARLKEAGPDLAQRVLAEFSSPALRREVLDRVGKLLHDDRVNPKHHAGESRPVLSIASALELVDQRCPDQAFSFRAALILIAMAIEDRLTYDAQKENRIRGKVFEVGCGTRRWTSGGASAETMGTIETSDGVTLHYAEAGSGRPLVLIPGWSQSAAQFKHQLAGLSDRYRVIALDLRGHGESAKPAYGYRIARFAKDVHDALVALDLTDVNLLSHSMGCSVVWCYWDLFGSARLAKLIFVDQSPFMTANPSWTQAEREATEFALDPPMLRDDPITLYRYNHLIDAVSGLAGPGGADLTREFIGTMFTSRMAPEEKAWAVDLVLKLPRPYAARLVYNHATQDWFDVVTRIDARARFPGSPWSGCVTISPMLGSNCSSRKRAANTSCSWRTRKGSIGWLPISSGDS